MPQFVRIGDTLINLDWVRAVEMAADGRMNVYLSEDRATGLVMRFSGDEARAAWEALGNPARVPLINPDPQDSGEPF